VPLCNHDGVLINDPILLKLDDERYWLSIADSNIWFWARAIAAERGLRVTVSEPDVSPLAVQGPRGEDVVASIFGDWVRALRYFWFRESSIEGIPVAVARSGWSKQGGFELYLMDGSKGTQLWNIVREAGRAWDIGPGNPNVCERIESGLISWGGDTDKDTNPFEVRMEKYVDLDVADDVVGIQALRRVHRDGVRRRQLGVLLEGDTPTELGFHWHGIYKDGRRVGDLTNCVWSYRLKRNIGFGLVAADCSVQDEVVVRKDGKEIRATLTSLPFI
jgi:glycine cleavage system aminomethyltransferase T